LRNYHTRLPVADIADHEGTSALRRELEQLSGDAGAKLLRALGVKGPEAELRNASDEFRGHCLALTLLGSYLTHAYNGDIRCREEVSKRLAHDLRQGVHALWQFHQNNLSDNSRCAQAFACQRALCSRRFRPAAFERLDLRSAFCRSSRAIAPVGFWRSNRADS
jgi:hypothetical protein